MNLALVNQGLRRSSYHKAADNGRYYVRSLTTVLCFSFLVCLLVSTASWAGWIEDGIPLTNQIIATGEPVIVSDGSSGAILAYEVCINGVSNIVAQRIDAEGNGLWGGYGVPVCAEAGDKDLYQITSDDLGGVIITWMDYRSGNPDIYAQRVDDSGTILWQVTGVPLCTAAEGQYSPQIISDGMGGVIITWYDGRSGNDDIYAQRVDDTGLVQWQTDGVPLCLATGSQIIPQITSDGSGGAIVTWYDGRSGTYDIYAQRVDDTGLVQWQTDGIPLCTVAEDQVYPRIVSDDSGGAIVVWQDLRNGFSDIYAQRVDSLGLILWQANGVPLCTAEGYQSAPQITADGVGGAIVTWDDYNYAIDGDIYTQRIDALGTILWQANGIPLCAATGNQYNPHIISDGSGGAIVTWDDNRDGDYDIYAQRVDGTSLIQWLADGVPLCTATGEQWYPQITSDGSGGAVVTWEDGRSGYFDVYAQRVDGTGLVQWQADGVPLCAATVSQYSPQITSDGSSGAIVAWQDQRSGTSDIYAQRVDGLGLILWQADGVPICTVTGTQWILQITSDGSGGAIITWEDYRDGTSDIYAQRIDSSGTVLWQEDGVPLCTATGNQYSPQVASDGSGGAIVTWEDGRSGNYNIYARRVDGSGTVLWQANGVPLCTAMGDQSYPQIASDGSGGAIVAWEDYRDGTPDIYAQRVDGTGLVQWQADGVPLCAATGSQYSTQVAPDGSGGAMVTWQDMRAGNSDIYAQRVDALGLVQWLADGVPLCAATGSQWVPQIISDGSGGAIVTWYDSRSGNNDIYAQRVNGAGTALWLTDGISLCTATGSQYSPEVVSDGSGGAIVTWQDLRVGTSDIYAQRVDALGLVQWQADGVPLCTATGTQWLPQIASDGSGGAIVTWYDYRIVVPHVYAARVSDTGELVATLLQSHTAKLEGNTIRLSWTLAEIDNGVRFTILRASAPDWIYSELEDAAIVRDGLSFSFTDGTCLPGSVVSYRVDVEVEGMPARTLFETERITVPELPLTLHQNHPNPFNPSTVIRFYLPESGDITLDIYNVLGQRVARLAEGRWEKGLHEVPWDGRNGWGARCSSGVYFMRLRAGKGTISRKMVLLR